MAGKLELDDLLYSHRNMVEVQSSCSRDQRQAPERAQRAFVEPELKLLRWGDTGLDRNIEMGIGYWPSCIAGICWPRLII